MVARSVPDGHGRNVVNVILVDFRGFDTSARSPCSPSPSIGAVALARVGRRAAEERGDGTRRRRREPCAGSPFVDVSVRVVFHAVLLMSLWLLFAGHNQPGGGFVGGLLAGSAITLRYIAGGIDEVRGRSRFRPWTVLGAGLLLAAAPRPRSRCSPAAPSSRSASRTLDLPLDRRGQGELGARVRHRRLPRGRRHGAHGVRGLRRRPRGGVAVTVMLAAAAAALFAIGTYLLLQRKLSRIIIGLGLLTHGANILLITAGRRGDPPIIGSGDSRRRSPTRCRRRSRSPPSSSPSASPRCCSRSPTAAGC